MKRFESAHNSTVRLSGAHDGIVEIDLDWFEENICVEAEPTFVNDGDPRIIAYCDCCEDSPFCIPLYEV